MKRFVVAADADIGARPMSHRSGSLLLACGHLTTRLQQRLVLP